MLWRESGEIEKLLQQAMESLSAIAARPVETCEWPRDRLLSVLTLIATQAWRASLKTREGAAAAGQTELRRVHRHVEAILEAVQGLEIEIKDWTGLAYDAGMALKVASFQPVRGLTREEIVETIKPSVTFRGQLLQLGEVVVGTPS